MFWRLLSIVGKENNLLSPSEAREIGSKLEGKADNEIKDILKQTYKKVILDSDPKTTETNYNNTFRGGFQGRSRFRRPSNGRSDSRSRSRGQSGERSRPGSQSERSGFKGIYNGVRDNSKNRTDNRNFKTPNSDEIGMKDMVKILMKESKETKDTIKELAKTVAGLAEKVKVNETSFITSVTEEVETHYNTSRTDGKHGVIDS